MAAVSLQPSLAASVIALTAVLASGGAANALVWHSVPSITMEAGGDSNIWLNLGDNPHASWGTLTAAADITARDAGFNFRVAPRVQAVRYADNRAVDRNDAFTRFDLGLNRERWRWSFGGNYARESTLTSEFAGSGIVGVDVQRVQRSIDTGWSRVMSTRSSLSLTAGLTKVAYGDTAGSPFVGYDYRLVQVAYAVNARPRSSWQFAATHSILEGETTVGSRAETSVQIDWSREFSEKLRGTFGVSAFDLGSAQAASGGTNAALHFVLTRESPRWRLESTGGRSVRPAGLGLLVSEDAVTFESRRRFGSRVSVAALVRVARVAVPGIFGLLFFDRDYSQVGVTASWQLGERWILNGTVNSRAQQSALFPRADGLQTSLAVSYRGR